MPIEGAKEAELEKGSEQVGEREEIEMAQEKEIEGEESEQNATESAPQEANNRETNRINAENSNNVNNENNENNKNKESNEINESSENKENDECSENNQPKEINDINGNDDKVDNDVNEHNASYANNEKNIKNDNSDTKDTNNQNRKVEDNNGDDENNQVNENNDNNESAETAQSQQEQLEEEEHRKGFKLFGIWFAPLNTPLRRRLQTFAVAQSLFTMGFMPFICTFFLLLLLVTPFAPFALLYIAWIFLVDRETPRLGTRRVDSIRRWRLWRHYRDYFPIELVKTAELSPDHNYLIGYHPHGIAGCGAFCNFGTEATGFSSKFPGITPHMLTLKLNFYWPFLREYYMAVGLGDVSSSSMSYLLSGKRGVGNAAVVVIGGAQEALDARPGSLRLTLMNRKGFVRMALRTGAHLVPCYSFGENDLFLQADNPPGSRVRAFQQLFKGMFGSSPPLFYGRGIFNYSFGIMPYRHQVATVVGQPIAVERTDSPTQQQVDELHNRYICQLKALFDSHKVRFGLSQDAHLTFV